VPDDDLTVVIEWHSDGILRRDEEGVRNETDAGSVGKGDGVWDSTMHWNRISVDWKKRLEGREEV
jgi:hypothetical protein